MFAVRNVSTNETNTVVQEAQWLLDEAQTLPEGTFNITILRGDAWIFLKDANFPLHAGQTCKIVAEDSPVQIRKLYRRGVMLEYALNPVE